MTEPQPPIVELVRQHVERLSRGDVAGIGEDANRILDRVHRGDAIGLLQPLLDSRDPESVRSLAFILSESGQRSIEAVRFKRS